MSLLQVSECLSCYHEVSLGLLLPHLAGVAVEAAEVDERPGVHLGAVPAPRGRRAPGAASSPSGCTARYGRRLADAPVGGQPVTIRLAVRRFLCGNPDCRRGHVR